MFDFAFVCWLELPVPLVLPEPRVPLPELSGVLEPREPLFPPGLRDVLFPPSAPELPEPPDPPGLRDVFPPSQPGLRDAPPEPGLRLPEPPGVPPVGVPPVGVPPVGVPPVGVTEPPGVTIWDPVGAPRVYPADALAPGVVNIGPGVPVPVG